MPPIRIDAQTWKRALSRVLFNGPPLSGKTTGTKTLPRRSLSKDYEREIAGDTYLVVVPGEHGYSSVVPEDDYHIFAWEVDPAAPTAAWQTWWKEFNQTLLDIVGGKYGPVESLVIDGLHLLYEIVMRIEGWTPSLVDDKESGKQYTKYHAGFLNFLSRWLASPVPMVAATCYDGLEAIDPDLKNSPKQVYPALPGMMAKRIMGVFPVAVHTEGNLGNPGSFKWTLRPLGKTQAAGLHVPKELLEQFPKECSQDWRILDKIMRGRQTAAVLAGGLPA